jgi:NAD(P)-dependent dehydrogenase (short-subunit alcohol dehydrogenase family)
MTIAADLGSQTGARKMAQQLSQLAPIDVLIANAGASNAPELWETTEAQFDQVVDANFKSTFFTVTETRHLLARNASVILTSSVAHDRGRLGDPLYGAVKAAVRSLGRGFAADPEFLERRIRVNTISFGAVKTPMTSSADPAMAKALDDWAATNVPVGRWADAEEAAAAMLFLAGSGSSYMPGAELAVDGGLAQL